MGLGVGSCGQMNGSRIYHRLSDVMNQASKSDKALKWGPRRKGTERV